MLQCFVWEIRTASCSFLDLYDSTEAHGSCIAPAGLNRDSWLMYSSHRHLTEVYGSYTALTGINHNSTEAHGVGLSCLLIVKLMTWPLRCFQTASCHSLKDSILQRCISILFRNWCRCGTRCKYRDIFYALYLLCDFDEGVQSIAIQLLFIPEYQPQQIETVQPWHISDYRL